MNDIDKTDDEKLLESLNPKSDNKKEKKSPIKQQEVNTKEVIIVAEPEKVKETLQSSSDDSLDPKTEFLGILADLKVSRGAQSMTDMFFSGDINDPSWLDQVLVAGGLNIQTRKLIISRYYGATPDELGLELKPINKTRLKDLPQITAEEQTTIPLDVQKMSAQMIKAKWDALQAKSIFREMERLQQEEEAGKAKLIPPKKVIERPLIDSKGEMMMKDGKPVVERIEVVGEAAIQPTSDPNMQMFMMFMSMMKDMRETNKTPPVDPNIKPAWAIDLERKVEVNKAEEEKKRLEIELTKEKEKREEQEKRHKEELEKQKARFEEKLEAEKEARMRNLADLKESFQNEMKHRDELNTIVGQITNKHDEEIKTLKSQLELNKKDIQGTVVQEASKTISKTTDKATEAVDSILQPMVEVMRDNYRTQIDLTRKNQGLDPLTVPKTTEEEIRRVINK